MRDIYIYPEIIQVLSKAGRIKEYAKKEVIYFNGNLIRSIFILLNGSIKLNYTFETENERKELIIDLITENEIIGITSLFRERYKEDAITLEDCAVLEINKEDFYSIIKEENYFERILNTLIINKTLEFSRRIEEFAFKNTTERIKLFLLYLAKTKGKRLGEQLIIKNILTNNDIGNYVLCSRQSVSKVLNRLRKDNIIRKMNSYKIIVDDELLKTNLLHNQTRGY